MNAKDPEVSALAEAIAQLQEAMSSPRGGSSDPERRRAAARLSELARCEDVELASYAKRHLPGRAVSDDHLRVARDLILEIAGIIGPKRATADALEVLGELRGTLERRLQAVDHPVTPLAVEGGDVASACSPAVPAAPPAFLPLPVAPPRPDAAPIPPPFLAPAPAPDEAADSPLFATSPATMSPFRSVLPFVPMSTDEASRRLVAAPRREEPVSERRPPKSSASPSTGAGVGYEIDDDSTMIVAEELAGREVLPFQPPVADQQPAPSSRLPPLAPVSERARPTEEGPAHLSAETMKRIQAFSLAQYAGVCAMVTAYPAQVVQIRSQYGLDVHAWTALHALWEERFQRDTMLRPQWEALVHAALVRSGR